MAVITTALTPEPEIFSYRSKRLLEDSIVPIGECFFYWDASITASGAGDTQVLSISMALPQNYSYSMLDLTHRIYSTNGVSTFELICSLNYLNAMLVPGATTVTYQGQSAGEFGDANGASIMIFDYPIINTAMLKSDTGGQASILLVNTNANQDESQAHFSNGMVRLLQYEYDQAFEAAPNTPLLVRSR